jgi:hypothetical protein
MARAKRALNRSPLFVKFTSKVVTEDLRSLRRDASLPRAHRAQFQTIKRFQLTNRCAAIPLRRFDRMLVYLYFRAAAAFPQGQSICRKL